MYRMTIEKIEQKEIKTCLRDQWGAPNEEMVMTDVVDRSLIVTLTDEEYQAVKKGVIEVFK